MGKRYLSLREASALARDARLRSYTKPNKCPNIVRTNSWSLFVLGRASGSAHERVRPAPLRAGIKTVMRTLFLFYKHALYKHA